MLDNDVLLFCDKGFNKCNVSWLVKRPMITARGRYDRRRWDPKWLRLPAAAAAASSKPRRLTPPAALVASPSPHSSQWVCRPRPRLPATFTGFIHLHFSPWQHSRSRRYPGRNTDSTYVQCNNTEPADMIMRKRLTSLIIVGDFCVKSRIMYTPSDQLATWDGDRDITMTFKSILTCMLTWNGAAVPGKS